MNSNVRQVSNKRNIWILVLGIGLTLSCVIQALIEIFCMRNNWPEYKKDLIFLLLGIIGILTMVLGIINIYNVKYINNYLQNPDYGLDYQKELSTYLIIGTSKKERNGAIRFNKYSDWKKYLEDTFKELINNEDAYRFINRRLRSKEGYIELLISVAVPIELSMITIFYTASKGFFGVEALIAIIISAVFLISYISYIYHECKAEINFIKDFQEVIFPELYKKKFLFSEK